MTHSLCKNEIKSKEVLALSMREREREKENSKSLIFISIVFMCHHKSFSNFMPCQTDAVESILHKCKNWPCMPQSMNINFARCYHGQNSHHIID